MKYSLPIKICAAVLSILSCMVALAGFFTTISFYEQGFYRQEEWNYYDTYNCANQAYVQADIVGWNYYPNSLSGEWDEWALQGYEEELNPANTNFRFELYERDGKLWPGSTYNGEPYGFHETFYYELYNSDYYNPYTVRVEAYVVEPLTADDSFSSRAQLMEKLYAARKTVPTVTVISAVVTLSTFIYLLCAAGRKKGHAEPVVGGLHKVPFDLLSAGVLPLAALSIAITWNFGYTTLETGIGFTLGLTLFYSLFLFYVMSFTLRCKVHNLWSGLLVYRVYRWVKSRCLLVYHNLNFLWKSIVVVSGFALLTILVGTFCILVYDASIVILFWLYMIIASLALLALAIVFQLQYRRIQEGIQRIGDGDPKAQIDVNGLYGDMRRQAMSLNQIQASVQAAVEKQLKSERLKTELITNVSHDIKTPLTSIVNYVDLLKKQDVQDETAKEYIEVLDRQAARLKKLIEDLLEASKASTGNIAVSLMPLDEAELVKQVAGEYSDRLKEKGLELVLNLPEQEMPVLADGQLLWRVFDNLLNNALKYSQPGTRVYLDLQAEEGKMVATLRNISAYALHISGEELMERFVRGDSSRHTEGSGLGLSIARSLMDLMKGSFSIAIDGDLFKAQVILGRYLGKSPVEMEKNEKNCQGFVENS